jgi:hypothetical protein
MQPLRLTPREGGWIGADWGDGQAWLRFAKDERNRLTRIIELHVLDPTPETLRRVPLNRIHAAVTMRGAGLVQIALALGLDKQPPPQMFSTPIPSESSLRLDDRFRLKRPAGKRLDDNFYEDVAHAYKAALAVGLNPRKALVTDTGAADATVAGWIMKARRAGYLAETSRGKVTAEPLDDQEVKS